MNIKRIANAVTFFSGYSFTCLEADRAQGSYAKITQSNNMPYVNIYNLCFDDQMRVLIELIKWLGNYRAIIHGQMPWIRKFELLIFFLSWCEYQPHSKHWQHCFSEARFPWESLNSFHSILFKFQCSSMFLIIWKHFPEYQRIWKLRSQGTGGARTERILLEISLLLERNN